MTDTTANPTTEADSGHGHGQKARYDDINVTTVVIVGIVSAVVTLLTIMFVKGLLAIWIGRFEKMRADEVVNMPAAQQVEQQRSLLEGGEGTISIEEAKKKVLSTYGTSD